MKHQSIGGPLDYRLLAQLHRPSDFGSLAREAKTLAARGLSEQDIGQCLRLGRAAVRELLTNKGTNHD